MTYSPGMDSMLHDTTWLLDGPISVPDGVEVSLSFADGEAVGNSGCNRFRTTYRHEGDSLEFGPMAGTLMMCSDDAMAVERDVLARLANVRGVDHGGNVLELLDADGDVLLTYRLQAPEGVAGTWHVNAIHYPDREAIISVRGDLVVDIAEGLISGNAGCNMFNGTFDITDDGVAVGRLMSTRRFCEDPEGEESGPTLMEQEAALLAALENVSDMQLEGNHLTLLRPDGGISVSLHRD
jgi:heat shock protein HslJ